MKKNLFVFAIIACAVAVMSCNNKASDPEDVDRITFSVRGVGVQPFTKAATEVTTASLDAFYVTATQGAAGSETEVFNSVRFALEDGGDFVGDRYWPASNPSYHFYAANTPLQFHADGCSFWADCSSDLVYSYQETPTYMRKNLLTFRHAFALVDRIIVEAEDGVTVNNVNIRMTPVSGGTFDILEGLDHTDGTGWSDVIEGAETRIASATGSNDIGLFTVPGVYMLTASWNVSVGDDYTETITDLAAPVTLVGGKRNIITATLTHNAKEIQFSIIVLPWDENDLGEQGFPVR